jgi:hypothetical protein
MKQKLSGIADNFFSKNKDESAKVQTASNIKADEALIVPEKDRGNAWTRFMVTQSGGYDSQYYNKQEAKSTTVLAAAKFVSVSMATYAFMKAVAPAFKSEALSTLPTVGNVDPRLILAGGVAVGFWWGVSKLDTAVMHSMRAQKASKYVADNLGVNIKGKEEGWTGTMFRLGISAGALGITIPALLVTTSEDTINQYIRDKNNLDNAPIVQEYQDQFDGVNGFVLQLQDNLTTLQTSLEQLQRPDAFVSDIQQRRINLLNTQLERFQTQEIAQQERLAAQQALRDAAESRMHQELDGTRGSNAGAGPDYRDAVQDRDDALRVMRTIQSRLDDITADIEGAETELADINTAIIQATENRREDVIAQREALERQIETAERQLTTQLAIRETLSDVTGLAEEDPRYTQFNPDLAEQVDAYVDYMTEEANPLEWSRAGFMALIIISLELGVFALSRSRRANAGEVRGYLADIAKSEEAADLYHQIVENRENKKQDDVMNSLDTVKKRQIMEAEMSVFTDALTEMRDNPEYREQALNDVMRVWESMRMKANDNAPEDSVEEQVQKPRTPGNGPT